MAQPRKKVLPRLTLEKIDAAQDIKETDVDIPEWGGTVRIRGVSKAIFDKWMDLPADEWEDTAYLLSEALIDPKVTPEEALKLREKSAAAVNRLVGEINKISSAAGAEQRFLAGDA